jgi:hypothetical protein
MNPSSSIYSNQAAMFGTDWKANSYEDSIFVAQELAQGHLKEDQLTHITGKVLAESAKLFFSIVS